MIADRGEGGGCTTTFSSGILRVRLGGTIAGITIIPVHQCEEFTTAKEESVYTCVMMNSSVMNDSVRFGVYFIGRSESLDFILSHHLTIFHLSIQLLQ